MTGQPGRFTEGEPSVKSVTAALARAQVRAMKRAAAVDGRAPLEPSDEGASAADDDRPSPRFETVGGDSPPSADFSGREDLNDTMERR